jgi:cytochrome c peroxidase
MVIERWAWLVPLLLAGLLVACTQGRDSTATPATTSPITQPSSRPSPGGPTTTEVESGVQLFQRSPVLAEQLYDYSNSLPDHFADVAKFDTESVGNPTTDAGATLGRVLFYDVNLSSGRSLSCASCHLQSNSFTDRTIRSVGNSGLSTRRNSMSLANVAFSENGRFFWDERAATLEEQAVQPFGDAIELNLCPEEVTARVLSLPYYKPLVIEAFGPGSYSDEGVTIGRVGEALAQFMRTMVSADAPYDRARAQVASNLVDFPAFSERENLGRQLFFRPLADGGGGCAGCHSTAAFLTPPTVEGNNGIDRSEDVPDLGVYEITGDASQLASFRVASLRNIAVTGPYMHDGRFLRLADVIDHYNEDIGAHPNLSRRLRDDDGDPVRLGFSAEQKEALLAFLETLTDEAFLRDERFSDPFQ